MKTKTKVETETQSSPEKADAQISTLVDKLPGAQFFKNLNIGTKLTIGFGILVVLTFLGAGVSYLGSNLATIKINRTTDIRAPTALDASRAQANLLRMLADVRGYLALGDREYRESYARSAEDFEADLSKLEDRSQSLDVGNQIRLIRLRNAYDQWSKLPEQLFELRDDQLDREPAYRLLATDGIRYAGQVLIATNTMIDLQGRNDDPTEEDLALLSDMAKFQGNFTAMLSAMRGYVTTRNRIYLGEYQVNLADNQNAWERLSRQRRAWSDTQEELFDTIEQNRNAFLDLPEQIFEDLEGDRWREDLYLFRTKAVPLAEEMQQLLSEMTDDQQELLVTDLTSGQRNLVTTNWLILAGGIIALIFGLAMTYLVRETIAGPVRRLTAVAEQIRAGDLKVLARVESRDEVGILAETFNNMTSQLRRTLRQARKEKKRADDLLEVVIPIGVELTTEKDFNRLLEKMLLEAKSFCHADAGTLYLRTDDDQLEFVIVRNDTRNIALGGTTGQKVPFPPLPLQDQTVAEPGHCRIATQVALDGVSSNIPNHNCPSHIVADYHVTSLLTIPLKNSLDKVLGVLQLLNAQDPETRQIVPFDQNLQQMMESFSSLAVAALEAYIREQSLRQEIQELRIEIDETKRSREVAKITESDYFQQLRKQAKEFKARSGPDKAE